MPDTKMLDKSLGSRHRAALGITEETDAVVVVVSEERGTISFCFNGNIVPNLDGASLKQALLGLFGQRNRAKKKGEPAKPTTGKRTSMTGTNTGSFRLTVPGGPALTTGNTGTFNLRPAQVVPQDEDSVPIRLTDPGTTRPMPPASGVETPVPMTPSLPPPPRDDGE
jgi:hypothetical protein